ncbi:hypothetical protein M0802_016390 [Mischocyttarus mexicanus]|nr:hypothetical protein M0802_016390 [Mischocyttarus mexicanus]
MGEDKPTEVAVGEELSKKALKKQQKEAEKAAKKAERKAQVQMQQDAVEQEDVSVGNYGQLTMIQSEESHKERNFIHVKELNKKLEDQTIWLRGLQGLAAVNEQISKQMIKFISNVTKESIIDIEAIVKTVPAVIESCTQKDVEVHIQKIFVISAAKPKLPLQIEDAARVVNEFDDTGLNIKVNQDTRLDNRVLDLRTPANQAIFRVEAAVCKLFRDILTTKVIVSSIYINIYLYYYITYTVITYNITIYTILVLFTLYIFIFIFIYYIYSILYLYIYFIKLLIKVYTLFIYILGVGINS